MKEPNVSERIIFFKYSNTHTAGVLMKPVLGAAPPVRLENKPPPPAPLADPKKPLAGGAAEDVPPKREEKPPLGAGAATNPDTGAVDPKMELDAGALANDESVRHRCVGGKQAQTGTHAHRHRIALIHQAEGIRQQLSSSLHVLPACVLFHLFLFHLEM